MLPRFPVTAVLSVIFLCSCSSTFHSMTPYEHQDAYFADLLSQFEANPNNISYPQLWNAYLETSQVKEAEQAAKDFTQAMAAIDRGEKTCKDIDWQALTRRNFWAIEPHRAAANCFEKLNDFAQAALEDQTVEWLLSGILAHGDGEHFYSAIEIAGLDAAHEFVALADYDVVDWYGEFQSQRQAFYYVIIVNDKQTGQQKHIYFDPQRFLHAKYDAKYPFMGIEDGWKTDYLDLVSFTNRGLQVAAASAEIADENLSVAIDLYHAAIEQGSVIAQLNLGQLCFEQDATQWPKSQCFELVKQASEKDLVKATILLAYLYHRGIGTEKDSDKAMALISTVTTRLAPGVAWQQYAKYFQKGYLGQADPLLAETYIDRAIAEGGELAQLYQLIDQIDIANSTPEELDAAIASLEQFATKYHDNAQVSYITAMFYWKAYKLHSPQFKKAKAWLEKAVRGKIPDAYFKLGLAEELGYFGQIDLRNAFIYYQEAAIRWHGSAQLKVGYFNDTGTIVGKNYDVANAWYLMCTRKAIYACYHNLGVSFEHGKGVQINIQTAVEFYRYAAENGYAPSQSSMGYFSYYGIGMEKDLQQAFIWFDKAAQKGDRRGQFMLGKGYFDGDYLVQDYQKAMDLFLLSANQGYSPAQYFVGLVYEQGLTTDADIEAALAWWKKAANNGNDQAAQSYSELCVQIQACEDHVN